MLFHQGWTDIVNCFALVSYFSERKDEIVLLIRDDSKELVDFYTKNISNVRVVYVKKEELDNPYTLVPYSMYKSDCLFGVHDRHRNDKFRTAFVPTDDFVNNFYTSYGLDPNIRMDSFSIDRDLNAEEAKKREVVGDRTNYIVCHDTPETRIDGKKDEWINMNCVSNVFFDCIKILEDADELHLIDSVWAAICYLLDCRYGLFQNKKVVVYCKRDYYQMFSSPRKLKNWTLV